MIYDLLAPFYDAVNSEIDYSKWADFITEILNRHNKIEGENIILDLGCGTGNMTLELAERGYDMIGVDYSVQMLDVARNRAEKLKLDGKILWLCQDMSDFELYGTVDAAVSCLDCINHITDSKELDKCFDLLTLSDASILATSYIDVYTADGTPYVSATQSVGSVVLTFEAQVADLAVAVVVHNFS